MRVNEAPPTITMQADISERASEVFAEQYQSALQAYLDKDGEQMLRQAYEFGRDAILSGLGLLDVIEIHYQTLGTVLSQIPPDTIALKVVDAKVFLEETLSPFEITYRGYKDAVELVQHVTQFTSMACHEVKSPITSILSSAGMLREMLEPDQDSTEDKLLMNVLQSVSILKARTNDMMDIAGLYSGMFSIQVRPVEFADFLQRVYEHLEPEVRLRDMQLNLTIAKHIPPVELDPDRIEQVITNLVQNATKYASQGGRIDLKATVHGQNLLIEVRDYGEGLSAVEQRMMLLVDKSIGRDNQARGTGLGLILSRKLVEAHHGTITISSKPGKGSRFKIWLPLLPKDNGLGGTLESSHR